MTWQDAGRYGRLCREITNETGSRAVCHVWTRQNARRKTRDGTEPWPQGEANFRLILAAPQMLEALEAIRETAQRIVADIEIPTRTRADWRTVEGFASAAIAAVKGESGED